MAKLNHPANLKYTRSDEWVRVEGDVAYIGITDYAQDQLGDIVFIQYLLNGDEISQADITGTSTLSADEKFGDIESVKATSELLAPLSGTLLEVNDALKEEPETINDDPYEKGWMLKIQIANPAELDDLMDAEAYLHYISSR